MRDVDWCYCGAHSVMCVSRWGSHFIRKTFTVYGEEKEWSLEFRIKNEERNSRKNNLNSEWKFESSSCVIVFMGPLLLVYCHQHQMQNE